MFFAICYFLAWLPLMILFPTKVIGKKNIKKKTPYVLTCNHFSNADPVILDLYLVRKLRFLAKKELFEKKFNGWILRQFGGFPINRDKPEISAFKYSLNVLKENKILAIFPEGTRNKDLSNEGLQQLKNGAIVFASKGGAQLLPVVIYKRAKVFRRNYILIGEPIDIVAEDTKRLTKEEIDLNTRRLVDAMNKLRSDMDEKLNSKRKKRNEKK